MPEVTCRFCGKKIDKSIAYCVRGKSGRNTYYCSQAEHEITSDFSESCTFILGFEPYSVSAFPKLLGEVVDMFSKRKVMEYVISNRMYLQRIMARSFTGQYSKLKYFFAVVKNGLIHYDPDNQVDLSSDFEFIQTNWRAPTVRKTLEQYENEYLQEDDDVI